MFARLDANGDGKVTLEEFSTAMAKRFGTTGSADRPDAATVFQKTDADKDGSITLDEFKSAFKAMRPPSAGGPQGAGGPPPSGGKGDAAASAETQKVFDEMDTNKDGKVSLEELTAALKKRAEENRQPTDGTSASESASETKTLFAAVDSDGDGSITQQELTSFFQQLAAQRSGTEGYNADGSPKDTAPIGYNLETTVW